ncbi:hypothetical protein ACFL03_16395 [Thermodesulfobacteriota bacterium]
MAPPISCIFFARGGSSVTPYLERDIFFGLELTAMTTKKDLVERREHKRFKAKEGAFAVLTSDNKLGQIQDISKSGLTFQYIGHGEPSSGSTEMEIFSTVYDFYLNKVPVKSVVDIEVDSNIPFSSVPIKQLKIQFGEMTPIQSTLLDYFIQNHTYA